MYTPRLAYEIMAELVARVISTSRVLTDLAEGSVLGSILGSVAEEVSAVERRIKEFVDAYFLQGVGANLDRRLRDFPAGFPPRRGATPATGGAFRVVRDTAVGTLTIAPGGMLVQASSQPTVLYKNVTEIFIDVGETMALDIPFVALTPGALSNLAQPGLVDMMVRSAQTVIECTNTSVMAGGTDRERDDDLRERARRWIASLALSQNRALESVALNFQASDGTILTHARIWNDPDQRGYSELVVDDGSGMIGYTQPAATYSGTLPTLIGTGSRYTMAVDGPIATAPTVTIGGVVRSQATYRIQHERNVLYLNRLLPYTVTPGDAFSVGGHTKYVGIMAELQAYINAVCVSSGVTVRVAAPTIQYVSLSFNMVGSAGMTVTTLNNLRTSVKRAIVAFIGRLPPGAPLLMYRLIGVLNTIPGLVNIVFDQTDAYPGSPRHKLVARLADITGR